jgi:opacity protein-like surface antigen
MPGIVVKRRRGTQLRTFLGKIQSLQIQLIMEGADSFRICFEYLGALAMSVTGEGLDRSRLSRFGILSGIAFAMTMSASSGAFAQCTSSATGPGALPFGPQLNAITAAAGASAGALASGIGNVNTAFLSQQGSAFVSAPGDPQPNQEGGGVWTRGVGGEFTSKFTNSGTGTVTSGPGIAFLGVIPFAPIPPGALNTNAQANCAGSVHATYEGMQVGQDISKLNVGGWNLHVGTTAGYLASRASDSGGGTTNLQVPFLGTYFVATHGRFFADLTLREEFYGANLTQPAVGVFNQQIGAHGYSVATSAGYNFPLANNWFIEPSSGFIYSRTNVDSFNVSGGIISQGIVGSIATSPVESELGRLTLRVGTTVASENVTWQPFGSVSVFHEFADNVISNGNSFNAIGKFCPIPLVCGVVPLTITGMNSTSRVGTYGQYSLGVAAQLNNTGWLGFVRVDYKDGSNLESWAGNAGLRYQFTPEMIASVMPTKAPVKARGVYIPPTNWTGFYVGGFLGAAYGNTDVRFVGDPNNTGNNPRVAGGLGGGEIGYNYQTANHWVVGVEADLGAANLQGSRSCTPYTTGFAVTLNCQDSSNWMATATARLGYAWGRTLFYVKGGGAWEDDSTYVSCIFGPTNGIVGPLGTLGPCRNQFGGVTNGFNSSGTRTGWTLGYGTEFDLGKSWSAKAEYAYIDFGSRTALTSDGVTTMRDSGAINQVKIGVNYRFTPGVVVAKY